MTLYSSEDLGAAIRARRKALGYTQAELAEYCNCGTRFISDLENGKDTIQFGKVLQVVNMLGMDFQLKTRGQ